jgi:uncharacterized protein (TIGR03382 family)
MRVGLLALLISQVAPRCAAAESRPPPEDATVDPACGAHAPDDELEACAPEATEGAACPGVPAVACARPDACGGPAALCCESGRWVAHGALAPPCEVPDPPRADAGGSACEGGHARPPDGPCEPSAIRGAACQDPGRACSLADCGGAVPQLCCDGARWVAYGTPTGSCPPGPLDAAVLGPACEGGGLGGGACGGRVAHGAACGADQRGDQCGVRATCSNDFEDPGNRYFCCDGSRWIQTGEDPELCGLPEPDPPAPPPGAEPGPSPVGGEPPVAGGSNGGCGAAPGSGPAALVLLSLLLLGVVARRS